MEVNVEIFQHALWLSCLFVLGVWIVLERAARKRHQDMAEKGRRVTLRKAGEQ